MKIARVRSHVLNLQADEPLADAKPMMGHREMVLCKITTADGIEGIGVTFFGGALTRSLGQAVRDLGEVIVGENPLNIERCVEKMKNAGSHCGPGGIFHLALAAIDTALWDIKGKILGQPVAKLLGGHRDVVPAYASGALHRFLSLKEVEAAAAKLVERGWKSMKTQMALPNPTSPDIEVERMKVVRAAIGPEIQLMCDINQRWNVHQAISIGHRVEEYNLHWLEDVTTADDYDGLARVTHSLKTPVAGGEYVYGIAPFRQMLEARSVDIPMIDLVRVGGITQWMKVAGMAEAFNLPVVSHLIPEVHVHLIAAVPNGEIVEYMPWTRNLFADPPLPEKGMMAVPAAPGLGFSFTRELNSALDSGK
ncbi:MAG TPA: mandelate racemase/muconate lactonizing enzyme family protein [Hyphomicrobiaceae bacterium]|nr:mandelate racemase/muconate lactonizing enzyme family protein [Hyphomicrobiaceae bacterium]